MIPVLHPLHYDGPWPQTLNNPLDYEPHPVCLHAIQEALPLVERLMGRQPKEGKMFGVLVVKGAFLLAFSGQMGSRATCPGFVPPVFDYLHPDGFFKKEEAQITQLNQRIDHLLHDTQYTLLTDRLKQLRLQAEDAIRKALFDVQMGKRLRDQRRQEGFISATEQEAMIRESQFQKAELRRTKQRFAEREREMADQLKPFEDELQRLRQERKARSEQLQRWLFSQFEMLNVEGDRATLLDIFASTPAGFPPSGAGECCEPKLLQYAYSHGLEPLQMAMFWYGPPPRDEVRHHLQCYPACRGKCKPILEWMLKGQNVTYQTLVAQGSQTETPHDLSLKVVGGSLQDGFAVFLKPAGMLSVPGNTGEPSVESVLREQYREVYVVHRLDQDTSGLILVAFDKDAYRLLQQQFSHHQVEKTYIAELAHPILTPGREGTIDLPLAPDPLNRPYQRVDHQQGKRAVTQWKALTPTRIELHPLTGRTHQLRVHCAHLDGLACPIRGDRLYGQRAERLFLHAAKLTFTHPTTLQRITMESPPPF